MVNFDFSCLTGNKTIAKTRVGSVSFADLEKLEKCSRSLLEGNSHVLWLLSALLSQLKSDGFSPSDLTLFHEAISSISCTLASQTSMAAAMSDFVVSKRQKSHLAHVSLPILGSQKLELLILPGSDSLFGQSHLEKVSGQVKEDSFISSSLSLAKLAGAKAGGKGKSSSSSSSSSFTTGSSHYLSLLDYSRPGLSGFRKRSASPAHGGGGKRGHGGRGLSLSLVPARVFGNRSHVPVP